MNSATTDPFETMIRDAGEAWLFDWFSPDSAAFPYLRDRLVRADSRARERFGDNAPRLTPDALIEEYKHNPHKVRAFLQVLDPLSPDMLVMVWRILHGMSVAAISMEYEAERKFSLSVRLCSSDDDRQPEEYSTSEIYDAIVLRHLGVMKTNGRPLFDGFYALNLGKP
jgi:hypothetical protein